MSRSKVPRIVSLLYTQNPFYLISACLFVYGLKRLFRNGDSTMLFQRGSVAYMEPWGLMSSFAAVTLLMAVTAILVVRLGKVWEDARSLVLIVLLMLLAISVSLDELLTLLSDSDNVRSHLYLTFTAGVCFAIGICEVMIRCMRIQFGFWYRMPLYGFLLLFFLWPGLLLTEVTQFSQTTTRWLIVAFPTVAGAVTLSLLPAVRRGSAEIRNNGTPWGWPLFPWTPFVFIAVAVCLRAYFLTMSYDVTRLSGYYWDTIFGIYQLVPFLLAVLVLLLEMARVEKIVWLQNKIMLFAPLMLVLSYPWLVPWYRFPAYSMFSHGVVTQFASPVFITVVGLVLMYGWAWWKEIRFAELGFSAMVFLSSCIGPRAFGARMWQLEFTPWPLLLLAAVQLVYGLQNNRSLNVTMGALIAGFAGYFALQNVPQLLPWRTFLAGHAALMVVIVVGNVFRDHFADVLRELGPVGLGGTTIAGLTILNRNHAGPLSLAGYFLLSTSLAVVLWKVCKSRGYLRIAILQSCLGGFGGIGLGGNAFLRASLPTGLKHVVLGAISFGLAVFISVLKSGLSRRIRMWWLTRRRAGQSKSVA